GTGRVCSMWIAQRDALGPRARERLQRTAIHRLPHVEVRRWRRARVVTGAAALAFDARRGGDIEATLDERDREQQLGLDARGGSIYGRGGMLVRAPERQFRLCRLKSH